MKNLKSFDVYTVLNWITWLSSLITLYSSEPTEKDGNYWFVSIVSTNTATNSNKWFRSKEARVSVVIISDTQEQLSTNEEDNIDVIVDLIIENIVDEWCSKIRLRNDKTALYCLESDCTPLLYNEHNRAYKIKDFIIWYENG